MSRDGDRLRIWISTIVALAFVGAAGFTFWYRAAYNVMPGQSASGRVHWCSYPPLAWSSNALLAATYPAGQQTPTSCATLVYLRTGPDVYKPYSLDGGP